MTPEELAAKKKKLEAWSAKTESHDAKMERRERKRKRREAERQANMPADEKARQEEWMELLEKAKKQRLEKNKLEEGEEEFFKGFD